MINYIPTFYCLGHRHIHPAGSLVFLQIILSGKKRRTVNLTKNSKFNKQKFLRTKISIRLGTLAPNWAHKASKKDLLVLSIFSSYDQGL